MPRLRSDPDRLTRHPTMASLSAAEGADQHRSGQVLHFALGVILLCSAAFLSLSRRACRFAILSHAHRVTAWASSFVRSIAPELCSVATAELAAPDDPLGSIDTTPSLPDIVT